MSYTIEQLNAACDPYRERIRNLEDALREAMCPSALIDNKDETVGYCVGLGQCGCGMQAMGLCSVPQREAK
jgi:hypothetical protein